MSRYIAQFMVARLKHITIGSDMLATRFSLALGALLWAVFLFWPGDLFTPARTTYHLMGEIAHENVWATLFLIQGAAAMYTLFWDVRSKCSLMADAFLGCILWTSSTLACFLSHYHGIGTYQPPAAMSFEVIGMVNSWWHLIRHWAAPEASMNIIQEYKSYICNTCEDVPTCDKSRINHG